MNWPKLKSYDKGFFQEGRNGIILGEYWIFLGRSATLLGIFIVWKVSMIQN